MPRHVARTPPWQGQRLKEGPQSGVDRGASHRAITSLTGRVVGRRPTRPGLGVGATCDAHCDDQAPSTCTVSDVELAGDLAVGQLLVATQPGRGGYFDRSVVLLIEHQQEATIGLCLNLFSEVSAHNALAPFAELVSPPARVFEGGPVNQDVLVALGEPASPDSPPPGWERIAGNIGVADVNYPNELLATSFTQLRVFLGLSAWSPGQLESELIRGAWFRTSVRAEDVFGDPEGLWRRVLRRMGGTTGRWSTWTAEPALN